MIISLGYSRQYVALSQEYTKMTYYFVNRVLGKNNDFYYNEILTYMIFRKLVMCTKLQ